MPQAEEVIETARAEFNLARDDWRRMYTEREAFHQAVGMLLAEKPTELLMLKIELGQMVKAAVTMADHILAQPATGEEALSEVWHLANNVKAARGPGSDK